MKISELIDAECGMDFIMRMREADPMKPEFGDLKREYHEFVKAQFFPLLGRFFNNDHSCFRVLDCDGVSIEITQCQHTPSSYMNGGINGGLDKTWIFQNKSSCRVGFSSGYDGFGLLKSEEITGAEYENLLDGALKTLRSEISFKPV